MKTPNNEEKSRTTENYAVKGKAKKSSSLKKWGKELVSMILIVGVVSFAMDFYHSRSMPQGNAVPIVGKSLQGEDIDVIELSKNGKPVIVYFWATWCGACKFVSPTVNSFSDTHQIVSVALSSGQDERVQRFLDAKEYQFPTINDVSGSISRDWRINVTPSIVIIKDGKISSIATGVTSPIGLWLRAYFS
ncbi:MULTISPECIES: protein disulfide oxidoreductase [Vibrio]|uniref:Protein disulfide oxidoreductase n=1 Tax=Vibrio cyclitrophicus ZF270 TaxID=1136176 RepID=A0AAN0LQD3_9VIBR|nr:MULTISPECIES: protein disulfide oxidoreductase [Vibrio]KNH10996.1 membrane protein [Vibrio lentus]MBY7659691.1 protein disulfide oxidoreductase [Vibrio atlanticus]ERM58064.1 Membrane protein, suppressor for copper-sensitivity ScsD [Vibrio cyclitrophicus FF75]KAA8602479.1 Membrane protein suppressor for copper-sensitivity ScsD [Vibrio cyclitrophicus]MBE8558010.1 protein disulfide oxidoreductase [Vibrio sp. OPT24]|tara:strand:- start:2058 stop:2627 length:570 start_codon:yes stop_codon:yes gene_type:complete